MRDIQIFSGNRTQLIWAFFGETFWSISLPLIIAVVVALIALGWESLGNGYTLMVFSICVLVFHLCFVLSISRSLSLSNAKLPFHRRELVAFFALAWMLIIFLFGLGWFVFGNFGPSDAAISAHPGFVDALHFSVVASATMGFGEFVPTNSIGQMYLAFQILLSSTHTLVFVTFLLSWRRRA